MSMVPVAMLQNILSVPVGKCEGIKEEGNLICKVGCAVEAARLLGPARHKAILTFCLVLYYREIFSKFS